jgi:hypothetical protein
LGKHLGEVAVVSEGQCRKYCYSIFFSFFNFTYLLHSYAGWFVYKYYVWMAVTQLSAWTIDQWNWSSAGAGGCHRVSLGRQGC